MITADYHTHTGFSDDSDAAPAAMAERAIALGLKSLCITDHMDYLFPAQYAPITFVFDPDAYFAELFRLKETYKDRLEIRIGIELGLRNEADVRATCVDYYKKLAADYPFDFLIGSTHVLEGLDPYHPEYWETHGAKEGMRSYFEAILENVDAYDMFDVYGHLDYLVRYVPQDAPGTNHGGEKNNEKNAQNTRDYCFADYAELLEAILKKLISSGRGIEVNTSGYKYGLPFAHPRAEVLKLYRKLGGEILTVGSDAHTPEHMAYDFARAQEMLCSLGFRYYTVYRGRKAVFLPL